MSGNTAELLADLRQRDVRLWLEGDRLRCSAPAGALDPATRELLSSRRDEVIAILRHADALASRPTGIIPLKPGGSRPPLFAIPGHNGDVFCYSSLARRLPEDQPLLGVQPLGVDGSEPLESIEELARYDVDQIRRYRPEGPYLIAGYCAGGTIAFEVSRQLMEQGLEVGPLILFGSPFPEVYRWPFRLRRALSELPGRARRHLLALLTGPPAGRIDYVRSRLRHSPAPPQQGIDAAVSERRKRVGDATILAIRRYSLRNHPGTIELFVPSEEWRALGALPHQWRSVARGVNEHAGPEGSSLDVMLQEPFVAALVEPLRRTIEAVRPARAAPRGERAGS